MINQTRKKHTILKTLVFVIFLFAACQPKQETSLKGVFQNPPESARPWVFWYWIKAAVSEEGITADLEAMKENGIGGAYLIPIQEAETPPLYEPVAEQLSPQWWKLIRHAFAEAERLGLKFAMHSCDGFAVAGGPWITPKKSMQKVVWSDTLITGGQQVKIALPQPEMHENYYQDIAVYAYPTHPDSKYTTSNISPTVTTNLTNDDLSFLTDPNNTQQFKAKQEGSITYTFSEPFLCRTIQINTKGNTYAAHHLIIEASNDGIHYDSICRLNPARHGWQDYEDDYTHAIPPTKAKYFRFVYSLKGVEPGSEDLDGAKWHPALKVQGIHLSGAPAIHQYTSKNGSIWRIAKRTTPSQLLNENCLAKEDILNVSHLVNEQGILQWEAPEGSWTILRMGHTSTGHTNYIGGKGKGLECDKFNPEVAKFQFDQWFGRVFDSVPNANEVLKIFHIDSWECGSQNWSPIFADEFKQRRGYDIIDYLPVMAGVPIISAAESERILWDIRTTIDELVQENFFGTMAAEAKKKGCAFSSESIAPTFVSDALKHYDIVDIPMGEFWNNSPTHDKPNDILDAISGGHIYGKNSIQSEAFTTLRMDWNEHPAALKALGDRNFALGINKFVFHVFTHNPWVDEKPGMSMNTVGLFFQRDQTWWKQSKAWIEYLERCQALLQQGNPVVDIAVFTGEDIPSRGMSPDRLAELLPGLMDSSVLHNNQLRLENTGVPQKERPYSVNSSANTYDPANWIDPLKGYKYDAINKDALLRLASVKQGAIVLPGGMQYKVLVIPMDRKASPNHLLSAESQVKIIELAKAGATIILQALQPEIPGYTPDTRESVPEFEDLLKTLTEKGTAQIGKGEILAAPYHNGSLESLGILSDARFRSDHKSIHDIAWTHRKGSDFDIYFLSNQQNKTRTIDCSFNVTGKIPEIYNPLNGEINTVKQYTSASRTTLLYIRLAPYESVFVVFERKSRSNPTSDIKNWNEYTPAQKIGGPWAVQFDTSYAGPKHPYTFDELTDWSLHSNDSIRYFSGTATYTKQVELNLQSDKDYFLNIGDFYHLAEVVVNGKSCGIIWTRPHRVNITEALTEGTNTVEIKITNTWKNKIIGDNTVFEDNPFSFTTAPFRIKGQALAPSGLLGPVVVEQIIK